MRTNAEAQARTREREAGMGHTLVKIKVENFTDWVLAQENKGC